MKKLLSILVICLITTSAFSINLYSITNGNWNSGSTWSLTPGGAPCNCTPSSADNITISHDINLTMHLINQGSSQNGITGVLTINAGASLTGNYDIDIRSSGTLIVCGTLNVRNVIFSNGSAVDVCPSGNLIINGTFENKNSSNNVNINGNMIVYGTFTNGNGGIIGGSGNLTLMTGPASNSGTTFGCTGMDPCSTYPCNVTPCNVLPIELISFKATTKNKIVELAWTTASEVNNDYFTIEKSLNGIEFITVSTHKGAGSSNNTLHYTSNDNSPFNATSYYRLKQTDFDGRFSYSAPIAVKMQGLNDFQLNPNPSNGHPVVLVIPTLDGSDISLYIRDITGRVIVESTLKPEQGKKNSTFLLDPENTLKDGIYMVSVKNNGSLTTRKVVISN